MFEIDGLTIATFLGKATGALVAGAIIIGILAMAWGPFEAFRKPPKNKHERK